MIQNAFVGAYTNQVGALSKGSQNITKGAIDAAALGLGVAGFTGALGDTGFAKGAEHALAGRVGGIGGNIMLATIQEKKESIRLAQKHKQETIRTLKGLEKSAFKLEKKQELKTPAEILHTSLGDFPADSEMGKKISEAEEVE